MPKNLTLSDPKALSDPKNLTLSDPKALRPLEPKIVGARVFDPRLSFFKSKKTDRAFTQTISCSLCGECPLLAKGQCVQVLFFQNCVYGRTIRVEGPTQRARGFGSWVAKQKEAIKDFPKMPEASPSKLAFIGEYVYLPYDHMSNTFILKEDWVFNTVLFLVDLKPQSFFGAEIVRYQKEIVPLFVSHLKELDKEMYEAVIEARPFLKATNYVGRKAYLKTLNAPFVIKAKHDKYPVEWRWNGFSLTTISKHAYNSTWGGIDLNSVELCSVPEDTTTVVIQDNSWVNEETEFVD